MSLMFSVIVPVYNAEKYLVECVVSITDQTFQSYEIILVDDGSTDKSPQICDEFALHDPLRIRAIHQSNSGQFSARKTGIEHAQGKYLVFVDADDMLEEHALALLNQIYAEQRVDMIAFMLTPVDIQDVKLRSPRSIFARGLLSKDAFLRQMICTGKLNSIVTKSFIRKKYTFDDNYRLSYGEDYFMSLMVMDDIQTVWYEPTGLYRYRCNTASITHKGDIYSYQDYLFVADYTIQYIRTRNLGNDLIEEYLKHFVKIIAVALSQICLGKTQLRSKILTELHENAIIRRCEQYVRSSRIRERLPLSLFYDRRYGLLVVYEQIYQRLTTRLALIKRSLNTLGNRQRKK